MNTTLFTSDDVEKYVSNVVPRQRTQSFFKFCLSLGRILHLPKGLPLVRAFSQLMEEWEYFFSSTAMQGVKYVMARNSAAPFPQTQIKEGNAELSRPSVFKFNNSVVYEYLDTTNVSVDLDYIEVLLALCDTLYEVYDKLFHEDCFK